MDDNLFSFSRWVKRGMGADRRSCWDDATMRRLWVGDLLVLDCVYA